MKIADSSEQVAQEPETTEATSKREAKANESTASGNDQKTMQQYRVQYAQAKKQMTVSNEATRSENQATMCTGESSEPSKNATQ